MFTTDMIQQRIRQKPFVPLHVITSGGREYDVYHPDLVMVGARDLTIGMAGKVSPAQYERFARVAILHVAVLEDLPVPSPKSESNGQ